MDDRLNSTKATIASLVVKQGVLAPTGTVSVMDIAGLLDTISRLRNAFPDHFLHSFAVKANFYTGVLSRLAGAGLGAEVAGRGELALARAAGFSPRRIVFDAPIKTETEIAEALGLGLAYNIDNFQEFEKVVNFVKLTGVPRGSIGFRLNPQIGAGTIALSSTATLTSKFGVGLADEGARAASRSLCRPQLVDQRSCSCRIRRLSDTAIDQRSA